MNPEGRLGKFWEDYLQMEARRHFEELSSVSYELIAGRTNYCPKHEEMYLKLLRIDMIWLMGDMMWFKEKE
jgi:hypothetical protein